MTKAEREIPLHEQAWDKKDVESARQLAQEGDFYHDNTTILNLIRQIDALEAQIAQRDERIQKLREDVLQHCWHRIKIDNFTPRQIPAIYCDDCLGLIWDNAPDAKEGEGK